MSPWGNPKALKNKKRNLNLWFLFRCIIDLCESARLSEHILALVTVPWLCYRPTRIYTRIVGLKVHPSCLVFGVKSSIFWNFLKEISNVSLCFEKKVVKYDKLPQKLSRWHRLIPLFEKMAGYIGMHVFDNLSLVFMTRYSRSEIIILGANLR